MIKRSALASLALIVLGLAANVVLAAEVPTLDVSRTCRAESAADADRSASASCMADERKAREQLAKEWEQFTVSSRTNCTQDATGIAGVQSYVELLTCLQIARDAANLPKQ
jgi:hypothetical protein